MLAVPSQLLLQEVGVNVLMNANSAEGSVIAVSALAVQPHVSVMVTEYEPGQRLVQESVVHPVAVHEY